MSTIGLNNNNNNNDNDNDNNDNNESDKKKSRNSIAWIDIERSINFYRVERSYGKIDDVLSYVGGLFGLLMSVIVFIMSDYN